MNSPTIHYFGSDNPVRVGDRVLVRPLLGRSRLATIVYIPGQSKHDDGLGNDQWAYKLDDGSIYAGGFFPQQFPELGKRFEFVSRPGEEATSEVIQAYRIPLEEPEGQPGRDFLALIGCGTLLLIVCLFGIALAKWLFSGR